MYYNTKMCNPKGEVGIADYDTITKGGRPFEMQEATDLNREK